MMMLRELIDIAYEIAAAQGEPEIQRYLELCRSSLPAPVDTHAEDCVTVN